jgi:hypothetical protein
MKDEIIKIKNAVTLPVDWDELAVSYFQQRSFLSYTEKYNYCYQQYYILFRDERLQAAAVIYSLRLDLLTYLKIKSPVRMHIIGIPVSVSAPGIFGNPDYIQLLKNHIFNNEKGFVLFLNLREKPQALDHASGNTLPTIEVKNHFDTWNDYLLSLRSTYRRRLLSIIRPDQTLSFEQTDCSFFTSVMYSQYLKVFGKSKTKLEKLSFDFFKNLPTEFRLTTCKRDSQILGWNITALWKEHLYFFLGGIDYQYNAQYQTYFRLLANIIRQGIEQKTKIIELGQTAEIPKLRLGGILVPCYMEARHSNKFINGIIRLNAKSLEYHRKIEIHHVMKEF